MSERAELFVGKVVKAMQEWRSLDPEDRQVAHALLQGHLAAMGAEVYQAVQGALTEGARRKAREFADEFADGLVQRVFGARKHKGDSE